MLMFFLETAPFAMSSFSQGITLGSLLALGFGILFMLFLFVVAIYVYASLAWMKIAKKMNHKYPWLAWIPIANISLVLQLGKFHWAFVFLILIPVLGWVVLFVLGILSMWRIFEFFRYPGALSLIFIATPIPHIGGIMGIAVLILLGFLAWGKRGGRNISQARKLRKKVSRRKRK
ncbi:MAG: hypothetical protein ABH804_02895 [archaeon]